MTMAKGKGGIFLPEIKKRISIMQLKKRLKQALSCKVRKSNQFVTGKVQLREAFVQIRNNEAWIVNMHISPYDQGNRFNHDPVRSRKLLLHRKQIKQLIGKTKQQGYTIVPIQIHLKNGFAKVLIGVGKGKKDYDKREDLKKKEAKRDMARAFKDKSAVLIFT